MSDQRLVEGHPVTVTVGRVRSNEGKVLFPSSTVGPPGYPGRHPPTREDGEDRRTSTDLLVLTGNPVGHQVRTDINDGRVNRLDGGEGR